METQVINATEYRNVSLAVLSESKTNPASRFPAPVNCAGRTRFGFSLHPHPAEFSGPRPPAARL